jgi:hypothetical protein
MFPARRVPRRDAMSMVREIKPRLRERKQPSFVAAFARASCQLDAQGGILAILVFSAHWSQHSEAPRYALNGRIPDVFLGKQEKCRVFCWNESNVTGLSRLVIETGVPHPPCFPPDNRCPDGARPTSPDGLCCGVQQMTLCCVRATNPIRPRESSRAHCLMQTAQRGSSSPPGGCLHSRSVFGLVALRTRNADSCAGPTGPGRSSKTRPTGTKGQLQARGRQQTSRIATTAVCFQREARSNHLVEAFLP